MTTRLQKYAQMKSDPTLAMMREFEQLRAEIAQVRNEINSVRDVEKNLFDNPNLFARITQMVMREIMEMKQGEQGYTPVRGTDYYTEDDVAEMVSFVESRISLPKDGRDGVDGEKGKDGKDGKDGVTPVAGVDYPTEDQLKGIIFTEIASLFADRPKDNAHVSRDEIQQLIGKIQQKIDYKEYAVEIARGLESIKTEREKLDYYALKNRPDIPSDSHIDSKIHTVMRGGGDRVRVHEFTGDGTKTFTVPAHKRALIVIGTDFPALYKSTTDFTTSGITLTMTAAVDAPSVGASLALLYVE